jgi:von Willebrand factor type A domain
MRPSSLLTLALTTLFACGGDPGAVSSDPPDTSASQGPSEGEGKGASTDAGTKKDAGGKVSAPSSGGSVGGKKDSGPVDQGPPTCDKLQLEGAPNSPDILIVLDRSGSMVGFGDARNAGKNRWLPSVSAIKKLTSELTETVAFGLLLFPDPTANGGVTIPGIGTFGGNGMGGCTPGKVNVQVDLNTADKIAAALDRSMPDVGATPTAASLVAARKALDTSCADCQPTPKYVLLVTDGQPTCGMGAADPAAADVEATNAAIDDLTADGITTYVIGYDTASDPAAATVMDGFAMHGGTQKHYPVEDEATLIAELTRIAGALVPCEFELSMDIPDPAYVRVEIDGVTYDYGRDWTNDGRKIVLDPMGNACPKLRDAKLHDLKITRECEVIPVL